MCTGSSGGITNFFAKPAKRREEGNPSGGSEPPGGEGGRDEGTLPAGAGAGGSSGGGKLGGNPPTEFDGDRLKADKFMHLFSLHCLANIDAEQMANLMKRMAPFLGFIKGLGQGLDHLNHPGIQHWKTPNRWILLDRDSVRIPECIPGHWL